MGNYIEEDELLSKSKKLLDIAVLPFFTNLFYLTFVIYSFDAYQSNSAPTNIIALSAVFYWYIVGLFEFTAYGKSGGGLSESLRIRGRHFIVILIIISYPVFYLFWLPLVLYNIIFSTNSPRKLWQRIFEDSVLSLEFLIPNYTTDRGSLFLAYLYIGIPFLLFSAVYICIITFLIPFWYYIFSHFGLSTLGICLHVTFHFPNFTTDDLQERIDRSYDTGNFIHVYLMCLPAFILGLISCLVVEPTWHAICLLIASGVNFLLCFYSSLKNITSRIPNAYTFCSLCTS